MGAREAEPANAPIGLVRWARVALAGLVAGVVWHLLSAAMLWAFGREFLRALDLASVAPRGPAPLFLAVDLAMGVWVVALYAATRARFRRWTSAAGVSALAWWSLKTLQSAKWVALGVVPPDSAPVLVPTSLLAAGGAAFAGAWLYGDGARSPQSLPLEGALRERDKTPDGVPPVLARLHQAMNAHDLEGFLACFDPAYRSEQPAHPDRAFGGIEQVRKNWSTLFAGMPDFTADRIRACLDGDTLWTEWEWRGTRADGSRVLLRGVTLFGLAGDRIRWGRLYMEPVEESGSGIDAAVQRTAGGARG